MGSVEIDVSECIEVFRMDYSKVVKAWVKMSKGVKIAWKYTWVRDIAMSVYNTR